MINRPSGAPPARPSWPPPRNSWPPPTRARQRYAVLVDALDDEHEQSVVRGTLSVARELDARLLVVAGGLIDAPEARRRAGNFAFDLVDSKNALGILVLSSALGNATGPARLGEWLGRYVDLPVCCMGVAIPGYSSVRVDNAGGVAEAVRHLVEAHGKLRIGFVRGPAQSEEAELRYSAYRDALFTHGIKPDPRWVAEGDYLRPSGSQAVRTIFDKNRVSVHALDALVCANDYMALGALDELGRRSINVPEQIALIGFDDVDSAEASRPSLTTIRQPGGELGREGLRQLMLRASGSEPLGDGVLPVELKLRRSCGCGPAEPGVSQRAPASIRGSFEAALIQRRQLIVAELARAAQGAFGAGGSDWEGALLSALIEEMRDAKHGALSRRVQRLLLKLEQAGNDLNATPNVLSSLRKQALLCVADHAEARNRLEEAVCDAQRLTTDILTQVAVSTTRAAMSRARSLSRRVQEHMFESPAAVSRALAEHLPGLGIDACVIARLLDRSDPNFLGQVSFGFAPGKGHPESEALPLSRLPEHSLVESNRTLFILPVALGDERLGVAAFSVTTQMASSDLLEDLRELLATVLKVSQARYA